MEGEDQGNVLHCKTLAWFFRVLDLWSHKDNTIQRGGKKTNSSINKSGQLKCNFETTKNKLTVI